MPNRAFFPLAVAGFVSALSIRVGEPLLPAVAAEFDVAPSAAVGVLTGFALAYGLFQLAHGPLGDRFGHLRTVSVMLFAAGLASFGCALTTSIDGLTVFRFLSGMTGGAIVPLSFAYVGMHTQIERRQMVLARFIAGILLGHTLGPMLGGFCSDWVGWRGTFVVCGVGFLLTTVFLIRHARRERIEGDVDRLGLVRTYRGLLGDPHVRAICLFVALEGALFFGAFSFSGAYLHERFSMSYQAIGLAVAGFGLGGLGYSAMVRVLIVRFRHRGMLVMSGVGLAGCFSALGVIGHGWLAPVAIIGLGFSYFLMHNTLQTQATEMGPQARGSAVALFAFFFFVSQSLGAMAFGALLPFIGYAWCFVGAGVGLGLLALWYLMSPHSPTATAYPSR
ncbi:MAG: MFS transporter [Pseudomonadota bacterium]